MTIKQIQALLTYLGYDPGTVDGINGPNTTAAVLAFQRQEDLQQDGKPGPATQAALLEAVAEGRMYTPAAADTPSSGQPPDSTGTFWDEIKYFRREEFRCKCGGKFCDGFPAEPAEKLLRLLDRARAEFGTPGDVISGVRCEIHNRNVGGVATSRHKKGWAADILFRGKTPAEMEAWFKRQPETAYCYQIRDKNGNLCGDVHVDVIV